MGGFLLDRQQRVKIGDLTSSSASPNGGVPQGTISGPRNFLALINDLHTDCPMCKYVDDSTIYELCAKHKDSVLQTSANQALIWSNENQMVINADKTKELLICFCKDTEHHPSLPNLTLNGSSIERVKSTKILGVTLTSSLTWNEHVENIVAKAGKRIHMLYCLKRSGVCQSDMHRIYVSVVRPTVEYACQVWHSSLPKFLSDKIELVQSCTMRIIYPGISYSEALTKADLPTLSDRKTKICKSYFTSMESPSHKLHSLLPTPNTSQYGLRNQSKYPTPRARTNRFKNTLVPWCLFNQ